MRKLLWIGDAACDSGFARATHYTVDVLRRTWDVSVLGLNYRGDPHPFRDLVNGQLYPAMVPGGDLFGVRRVGEIVAKVQPDLVVIQNDPWNIPRYIERFEALPTKPVLVGAIAVDGLNCRGTDLNGLDHVVFWMRFAEEEARKGGYLKTSGVVPLGVDLNIYGPGDREEARRQLFHEAYGQQIPEGAFIVLNVNRNQPRKRLDLTMEYFAEFYHTNQATDAFLFMHVCPTGDVGYDINQLTGYYNLRKHVVLVEPGAYKGQTEEELCLTYRAADAQVSTTQGEGMGLTTLEGMACGLPQVVPYASALGEWATAAWRIPCSSHIATPNRINVIGAVPDREPFVRALTTLYRDEELRAWYREQGLAQARQPEFRWEQVGTSFAREVELALAARDVLR